jgi:hypothetical protein
MELLGPDGSAVSEAIGLGTQPAKLETIELPDDGIYTLVVDPSLAYTGAVTVRIDDRSALTADVVIGADESTLSVAFPEQRGLVMFHGTRGQRVSVNVIVPDTAGCCATNIAVLAPDGRELVTGLATASANEGTRLVVALPVSGIYSIELTSATDRRGMVIVSVTDESGS